MRLFKPKERIVATIGYQGHGKTVFLASLFWDSFFVLPETLKPFYVSADSPKADDVFYGNANTLNKLELPLPNPRTMPEPAVLEFTNVPHPKGRRRRKIKLTFYDIAGEVFTDDRMTSDYAPSLRALQHIFCSVARGYFPQQGRGFQTVALAEQLAGTEDLRALEDAAFYAVSRARRRVRDFPVKQAFFRLPSGRFAIGRTVDWGTDSLGREGNYLAHHLVLSRDDLLAAEANPFAILDAARLAEGGMDLTPRALPPLAIEVAPAEADFHGFDGISTELMASLAAAAVDGGERTALLIGDEAQTEGVLRGLFAALAAEERLRLTFSTHFYESSHLRSLFALATVRSRAEMPSQRESYLVLDLDDGEFARISPASAYADWLVDCLRSRRWGEIGALNAVLDGLRNGQGEIEKDSWPVGARACAALWERAGTAVARALLGETRVALEFLRQLPSPRELADALLTAASPSKLCGSNTAPDAAQDCLSALRSAATGKVWREWVKQWRDDPALALFAPVAQPWWRRWRQ